MTIPRVVRTRAATLPALLLAGALALAGCAHSNRGAPVAEESRANLSTSGPVTTTATTTGTSQPATVTSGTFTTEKSGSSTKDSNGHGATGGGDGGSGSGATDHSGVTSGTFDVTISGTVSGKQFTRSGTLRILPVITTVGTANGVNDVDVCLVSGYPAAQPGVGSVWFGSNSACDPGAGHGHVDLGYVAVDGSTVTLKPDERVAAMQANNFTSSAGIAACLFAPLSGELSLDTDGRSVSGSVELSGYGGAICGNSTYHADVSGRQS
jgi:hypothetical protein